jgi:hypothetical protein
MLSLKYSQRLTEKGKILNKSKVGNEKIWNWTERGKERFWANIRTFSQ